MLIIQPAFDVCSTWIGGMNRIRWTCYTPECQRQCPQNAPRINSCWRKLCSLNIIELMGIDVLK